MSVAIFLTTLSKTLKPSLPKPSNFNLLNTTSAETQFKFNLRLKPPPISLLFKTHKPKPQFEKLHHNGIRSLFTGIVEEMGEIRQIGVSPKDGGFYMKILAKTVLEDVNLGDSIAVNGTCLTVTEFDTQLSEFKVGLAPETLRKTSLVELEPG